MSLSDIIQISDLDLKDKRVLLREDYNVPLKDGTVDDDSRLQASLPTIQQLLQAGAAVIIISHLGRPSEGQYDPSLSLAPVAHALSKLLGQKVSLVKNWLDGVEIAAGEVVLCENVRFQYGEIDDDDDLARRMAALGQVYVNDAFATAHRVQTSTHGIMKYAPVSCAGPLLSAELKHLAQAFHEPGQKLLAVVGGAKISTKLSCLGALLDKSECLIVGGGIANTLLLAAGYPIGASLHEPALLGEAKELLASAEKKQCLIPLPVDVVCAKTFSATATAEIKAIDAVEQDDLIMDVGPQTSAHYADSIAAAETIIWNGPLGVFEFAAFAAGSRALAENIADSQAFSIAGGGETLSAIKRFGVAEKISYLSTGGGAFLKFIEGEKLPVIAMLEESAYAWAAMERAREY